MILRIVHFHRLIPLKAEVQGMTKTNQPEICKQYIQQSLNQNSIRADICNTELNAQGQTWVSTLPPLAQLDSSLKEFVSLKRVDLSKKIDAKLVQCEGDLNEHKEFDQVSRLLSPNDRVCQCV